MEIKIIDLIEVVGRLGVALMIAITMNRTEWYQSLPVLTLTNGTFATWMFSLSVVITLFWIFIPIIKSNYVLRGKDE